MNRQEHLQWAKNRAIEILNTGDIEGAFTSMVSDLNKHSELSAQHKATNGLGMQMLLGGHLKTTQQMRGWIEGYN